MEFLASGQLTRFHLAVSIIRAINFLSRSALKFRPPILVLHGDKDCYIPTKAVKKFVKKSNCPDISLKVVSDGYHELYLDKEKDVFFARMTEWIKGHLEAGTISRGFKSYPFKTELNYSRKINTRRLKIVAALYVLGMLM